MIWFNRVCVNVCRGPCANAGMGHSTCLHCSPLTDKHSSSEGPMKPTMETLIMADTGCSSESQLVRISSIMTARSARRALHSNENNVLKRQTFYLMEGITTHKCAHTLWLSLVTSQDHNATRLKSASQLR